VLEYINFMTDGTAEAWSCCSSWSGGGMLRLWFKCSLFVLSEHGVNTAPALEVCTKDKQRAAVHFLLTERMKGAEFRQQLAAKYGQKCLPQ
jgi:hypothetical protein